jgi:hypothetical protein
VLFSPYGTLYARSHLQVRQRAALELRRDVREVAVRAGAVVAYEEGTCAVTCARLQLEQEQ